MKPATLRKTGLLPAVTVDRAFVAQSLRRMRAKGFRFSRSTSSDGYRVYQSSSKQDPYLYAIALFPFLPMKTHNFPASVLTRSQFVTLPARTVTHKGRRIKVRAFIRYDDQCGNGHNTFSITGEYIPASCTSWVDASCGCVHEEIASAFPEIAPLIKWHLVSSDGPLHYVANTLYHATEHGPKAAWIEYCSPDAHADPLGLFESKSHRFSKYVLSPEEARKAEGQPGYSVKWDEKSAKVANLDYARSCAVWPDATREQLLNESALLARLPALMAEFKRDVESLGFTY